MHSTTRTKAVRGGLVVSAMVALLLAGRAGAQEPAFNPRPALPFPPGVSVMSKCGAIDDMQHVEFYDGRLDVTRAYVDTHEPSTVQLQWLSESRITAALPGHDAGNVGGRRWCTGTLVSDRHVLTAGHCFDIQDGSSGWVSPYTVDASRRPVFAKPEAIARVMVVNFKYQLNGATGQERTPDVYPIAKLVEYRRGTRQLDYAIIETGANAAGKLPGETFTPAKVVVRGMAAKEILTIIQHPQGDPKKLESGPGIAVSGDFLFYSNLDTFGGSSGSGVRDEAGAVIGVHTNGGCMTDGTGANRGVTMPAIAAVSDVY